MSTNKTTKLNDKDIIVTKEGKEYAVGEIKNSNRITKSVTPKGDITWYVKWFGSIVVLCAIVIRAAGIAELQWLDILCSMIGALCWLFVGIRWNDRALITLNSVISTMLAVGLLRVWLVG